MPGNTFGPMGDPQFWGDMGRNAAGLYGSLKQMGSIPGEADAIAEQMYPNSARDSSTKNAFRHALGTGLIAQHLGAGNGGAQGIAAATLAKMAGYGWEGLGVVDNFTKHGSLTDTRHDLNANAIGASAAMGTDKQSLIQALQGMANASVVEAPPTAFQYSPGHMTRTVR